MNKKPLLDAKIVVITGAGGLLGREFVKAVVSEGGTAVALDIRKFPKSKNIYPVVIDITSEASVRRMIAQVKKKFGRIDAVVNCAFPKNKRFGTHFEHVRYKDFCENINLHLGGYFLVSQQMALFFKKQGHGNIVNMASIYGVIAPRFEIYKGTAMTSPVEYAAIKSAIVHLTKYMARYFKGWNVRVNSISPGGIRDGQPNAFQKKYDHFGSTKGMLDPADLSGTLVFLLSDMSRHVNGQNMVVDDGWSL